MATRFINVQNVERENTFSNKRSKQKVKLKIGMIQVLQTYGADMKYDPHIHSIVTEGGFDSKST